MSADFDSKKEGYLKKYLTRAFATVGQGQVVESEMPKVEEAVRSARTLYSNDLAGEGVILPNADPEMARLTELIFKERFRQEPLIIVSPTCPDYSYEYDCYLQRNVYNFEELGEGVCLTAQKLLEVAPKFIAKLKGIGVRNINYVVLLADIEADDPLILDSMKLEKPEFLARVGSSAQSITDEANAIINAPVTVQMMSQFLTKADVVRAQGLIGQVKPSRISTLGLERRDLYSRWFKDMREKLDGGFHGFCMRRAREDAVKSLTFGSALRRNGVVALEATEPLLASLYNFMDGLPPVPLALIKNEY